ncbi:hypothetical protein GMRT_14845 [Giardia muris]|uniref:Uncharacterized protein n=1 Tax=Giardia muris TaxID=5742 RepID=A0A4Z1T1J1_GIAMU|nr:hypothetical protein GMRT_14845 [Giardia muris]|eukprot:TNJ26221.1 hypothetical protein GMRT_14845 [Giardia muris]
MTETTDVAALLSESDALLDELIRMRTMIQESREDSAADLLRRIRIAAVEAKFLPQDALPEMEAQPLEGEEEEDDSPQEIYFTDAEVAKFEAELRGRAAGGVAANSIIEDKPRPSSKKKRSLTSYEPGVDASISNISTEESLALLSAIQMVDPEKPSTLQEDLQAISQMTFGDDDVDAALDRLLEYHDQVIKDGVFKTEVALPIPDSIVGDSAVSEQEHPETYNPRDILNPNFTVLLTEEENKRVEALLDADLPVENGFRPSPEDLQWDAEVCNQLSMLAPIDRTDLIYASAFAPSILSKPSTTDAETTRDTNRTRASTIVTLGEPSYMSEQGSLLWRKHTQNLEPIESIDIVAPRLPSGAPDYIQEQRRDRILNQYIRTIDACLSEVQADKSILQLGPDNLKPLITDFYMSPANFELVPGIQRAITGMDRSDDPDNDITNPETPKLIRDEFQAIRRELPESDRGRLDALLEDVHGQAEVLVDTDSYYKNLDVKEYLSRATVLNSMAAAQEVEQPPEPYVPPTENPGITDPLLLQIWKQRQKNATNTATILEGDDHDMLDDSVDELVENPMPKSIPGPTTEPKPMHPAPAKKRQATLEAREAELSAKLANIVESRKGNARLARQIEALDKEMSTESAVAYMEKLKQDGLALADVDFSLAANPPVTKYVDQKLARLLPPPDKPTSVDSLKRSTARAPIDPMRATVTQRRGGPRPPRVQLERISESNGE